MRPPSASPSTWYSAVSPAPAPTDPYARDRAATRHAEREAGRSMSLSWSVHTRSRPSTPQCCSRHTEASLPRSLGQCHPAIDRDLAELLSLAARPAHTYANRIGGRAQPDEDTRIVG